MSKAKAKAKAPVPYMVESLKVFRDQINKAAPKRSKVSDGWIGDAKHAARKSDHNPEPDGSVDAWDMTNDPTNGVDSQKVAEALVASKDKRISYIICNGRIVQGRKGPNAWTWRKYNGANGHYHHMHLSVLDGDQNDKTPWKIEAAFKVKPTKPADLGLTPKQVEAVLKIGSKGEFVEILQKNLIKLGYDLGPDGADGYFGKRTEDAVKAFQAQHKLEKVDGWVGPKTQEVIGAVLAKKSLEPKIVKAEAKVEAAKDVVNNAAVPDKKISTTEVVAGITGASGLAGLVKEITDNVTSATESIGSIATSLGPWLLLSFVIVGGASYIFWDRRNRRLEARAVKDQI